MLRATVHVARMVLVMVLITLTLTKISRKLTGSHSILLTVTGLRGSFQPLYYCRLITYHRQRFARAAPAPRAKLFDSKNRGRAAPVNCTTFLSELGVGTPGKSLQDELPGPLPCRGDI